MISVYMDGQWFTGSWSHSHVAGNVTHHLDHHAASKQLSDTGYAIAGAALVLTAIFGFVNNLCVIVVLLRHRQLLTPVNLMILNLTISDFLLAIVGPPFAATSAFHHHWLFGRNACVAYAFGTGVSGMASIGFLSAISAERYWLIAHGGSISKMQTVLCICGVWVFAVLMVLPPVIGWSKFEMETPGIACGIYWESSAFPDLSYIVYLTTLGLVLPLGIIFWCYIKIIFFLRKNSQASAQSVTKAQGNITRMVAVMILAFLIAWMPYTLVSMVVLFRGGHLITAPIATLPAIFAKSAIIYNPVIYVLMNPQVRMALKNLLRTGSYATLNNASKKAEQKRKNKKQGRKLQITADGKPVPHSSDDDTRSSQTTRFPSSFSSAIMKSRPHSSSDGCSRMTTESAV